MPSFDNENSFQSDYLGLTCFAELKDCTTDHFKVVRVPGDGWCLLHSIAHALNINSRNLYFNLLNYCLQNAAYIDSTIKDILNPFFSSAWFEESLIILASCAYKVNIHVIHNNNQAVIFGKPKNRQNIYIRLYSNYGEPGVHYDGIEQFENISARWELDEDKINFVREYSGTLTQDGVPLNKLYGELFPLSQKTIERMFSQPWAQNSSMIDFSNLNINICIIKDSTILLNMGSSRSSRIFIESRQHLYKVLCSDLTTASDSIKSSFCSFDNGRLRCSPDYLSLVYPTLSECVVDLISWVFNGNVKEKIKNMLLIIASRSLNELMRCLQIDLTIYSNKKWGNGVISKRFGLTGKTQYSILEGDSGYRFIYKSNYLSLNQQKSSFFEYKITKKIKVTTTSDMLGQLHGINMRTVSYSDLPQFIYLNGMISDLIKIEPVSPEESIILSSLVSIRQGLSVVQTALSLTPDAVDIRLKSLKLLIGERNSYSMYLISPESQLSVIRVKRESTIPVKYKPLKTKTNLSSIECFPKNPHFKLNLADYTPKPDRLTSPEPQIYISHKSTNIPRFELQGLATDIISVMFFDEGTTISTHNKNLYTFKRYNARTFVHDFTFDILSSETDLPFSKIGLAINDEDDNKSPDLILKVNENTFYIYEFTTRRSDTDIALNKAFLSKDLKYKTMIQNRVEKLNVNIFYGIIAVTNNAVSTNITSLPEDLCEELIFRLRVASRIFEEFVNKHIEGCNEEERSMEQIRIESVFKTINMEDIEYIEPFSKEMYDNFSKPVSSEDKEKFRQLLVDAEKLSFKRIKEDLSINGVIENIPISEVSYQKFQLKKREFIESYRESYPLSETRIGTKASVQYPFILSKSGGYEPVSENMCHLQRLLSMRETTAMERLINSCLVSVNNESGKSNEFSFILLDEEERKICEKKAKSDRKKYRRVDYFLTDQDKLDLAEMGVHAKDKKEELKNIRAHKKKPFDLFETDTSDIDDLINKSYIELLEDDNGDHPEDIDKLLKDSIALHDSTSIEKFLTLYENIRKTRIAKWCRFISDVGSELSISVKQFCSPGTLILKKLNNFDVYLMVIPTGGPIFFSIIIPKTSCYYKNDNSTFKKIHESENYYYTDFVSVNSSKIRNLVLCESVLYSCIMLYSELMSVPVLSNFSLQNERFLIAFRLCLFSLLICLNDKSKTEEACTLNRYIQMEGFVTYPKVMDQSKMFSRFNLNIRSRLEVYITNRLIQVMESYSRKPCKLSVINDRRVYTGMLIPYLSDVDGSILPCDNPETMLNVVYAGYIKNKDEASEANSAGQLISKIIGWEDIVPVDKRFLGLEDPDIRNIQKHEFNTTGIRVLVDMAKQRITKTHGASDPTEFIGHQIIDFLRKQSLEQFATLKASSNFSEDYYFYIPPSKDKRKRKMGKVATDDNDSNQDVKRREVKKQDFYKREKVLIKLKKWMDSKYQDEEPIHLVVDLLKDALLEVEDHGCLHICIFKKNQHAGLREIYVLNFAERIIQKTIEDFARAILKCFPSETMMHPGNKYKIPEEMNRESRKTLGSRYIIYNTSDDAKKWNQGHYVTKFICMLVQFTPKYMHGFICRCLQLWLRKRIMMPVELLTLFNDIEEIHTMDNIIQRTFSAYKGRSQERWLSEPKQSYIETSSGMMQGILHYISSLFHTIILDLVSERAQDMIIKRLADMKIDGLPTKCVVKNMQSSDDSAMMIAVPVTENDINADRKISTICLIWFTFKEILSEQFGIYKSEKSTTMTPMILEFNSEFYFLGEVQRPTIRWVYASCLISEQETLVARQEEMSNTLKDVVEGGGTFLTALYCQIGQLILHYRLLGSGVSIFWDLFRIMISKIRDPGLGYFLMDDPLCPGLLGFNYNLWNAYDKTVLSVKFKSQLDLEESAPMKETIKQITPETISLSLFTRTTTIRYGNKKIWERIMNNLGFDENTWDAIEEKPEVLYFAAHIKDEVNKKIALKMKSPGVITSLGSTNSITRVISTGVYIMSRSVISTQSAYFNKDQQRELTKAPLLQLIIDEDKKTEMLLHSIIDVVRKDSIEITEIRPDELYEIGSNPMSAVISLNPDLEMVDFSKLDDLYPSYIKKYLLVDNNMSKLHFYLSCLNIQHLIYDETGSENLYSLSLRSELSSDFTGVLHRLFYKNGSVYKEMQSVSTDWKPDVNTRISLSHQQRNLLFPFEGDYQSIRRNLNNLRTAVIHFEKNHRRRVRSLLVVAGCSSNELFSLEEIAKYIWFRKVRPALPENIIHEIWSLYKEQYPFLRDSIQETKENPDCPFPNHISLRNFIARQSKTTRTIHLTGSHGKYSSQHTNILTVIKNNLSESYHYNDPVIDEEKRDVALNFESLMHCFAMTSELPLTDKRRTDISIDLLDKSEQLEISMLAAGSRRNRLSIIQNFVKEDPHLSLGVDSTDDEIHKIIIKGLESRCRKYAENMEYYITLCRSRSWDPTSLDHAPDVPDEVMTYFKTIGYYDSNGFTPYFVDKYYDLKLYEELLHHRNKNILKIVSSGSVCSISDLFSYFTYFETKKHKLFKIIRTLKLGIVGSYTVAQPMINGIYQGRGVWSGYFDDVGVCITIDSDEKKATHFVQIKVDRAPNDIKFFIEQLKLWASENGVGFADKKLKMQGLISLSCIYKFREVKPYHPYSVPIILEESLQVYYDLDPSVFSIQMTKHNIKLVAKMPNTEQRDLTIVQVRFKEEDINTDIKDIAPRDLKLSLSRWSNIIRHWLLFSSLDLNDLSFFSHSAPLSLSIFPINERLEWGNERVRNVCYKMKLDKQVILISSKITDPSVCSEKFTDFGFDDVDMDEIVLYDEVDNSLDFLNDIEDFTDLLYSDQTKKELSEINKIFNHPILDNIMFQMIQSLGANTLVKLLKDSLEPSFTLDQRFIILRPILEAYSGKPIDMKESGGDHDLDKTPSLF
ncbi:RNA-dependent RNA polymerase [Ramu stunt virus]|uniref:RNA-directed RNA polymerase L n=1 Tax=Ramu stunt virus TaxID=1738604 RepID=A0A0P0I843_9VIRU|nr:RNA-dependent RNA polymerase [Ramu stunt virus]